MRTAMMPVELQSVRYVVIPSMTDNRGNAQRVGFNAEDQTEVDGQLFVAFRQSNKGLKKACMYGLDGLDPTKVSLRASEGYSQLQGLRNTQALQVPSQSGPARGLFDDEKENDAKAKKPKVPKQTRLEMATAREGARQMQTILVTFDDVEDHEIKVLKATSARDVLWVAWDAISVGAAIHFIRIGGWKEYVPYLRHESGGVHKVAHPKNKRAFRVRRHSEAFSPRKRKYRYARSMEQAQLIMQGVELTDDEDGDDGEGDEGDEGEVDEGEGDEGEMERPWSDDDGESKAVDEALGSCVLGSCVLEAMVAPSSDFTGMDAESLVDGDQDGDLVVADGTLAEDELDMGVDHLPLEEVNEPADASCD